MSERVHYANAPIVEAVIDLRIAQPADLSISDLQELVQENAEHYPIIEQQYVYQEEGYIDQAGAPLRQETEHWLNGFRCISGDRRRVFYARLDGFAFSVRAPYEGWSHFRDEAHRLWEAYRSTSAVAYVTRIAVRYINRLDIPQQEGEDKVNLEDYMRIYPELPSDFPPGDSPMAMYFLQMQIPQPDIDSMLVINSTPQAPTREHVVSLILDFDLFRERLEEPWEAENSESIWSFLEKLHERKNEIFEASITDRTRRLIR